MEKHVLYIAIDYRVPHWEGIAVFNAAEVHPKQKTFALLNKNVFFKCCKKVKTTFIFVLKNSPVYIFIAALSMFIFVFINVRCFISSKVGDLSFLHP